MNPIESMIKMTAFMTNKSYEEIKLLIDEKIISRIGFRIHLGAISLSFRKIRECEDRYNCLIAFHSSGIIEFKFLGGEKVKYVDNDSIGEWVLYPTGDFGKITSFNESFIFVDFQNGKKSYGCKAGNLKCL